MKRPTTLTKFFSREQSLIYFELWRTSDNIGVKIFGMDIKNSLFVALPAGFEGSVWYDPDEMLAVKEKTIASFSGAQGRKILGTLRGYKTRGWNIMRPYVLGKKVISSWNEFSRFWDALTEYWVSMNTFIWYAYDDPRMPNFVKKEILRWRKESERYSERASSAEFLHDAYPQLRPVWKFLTRKELNTARKFSASSKQLQRFFIRRKGIFMLNGKVYPLRELNKQLRGHHIQILDKTQDNNRELTGTIAFPGVCNGTVKIVLGSDDLKKIKRGDIIVAPMTHPEYSHVLSRCRAVVTDEGGMLCHAAIVSRELKKPCIIGTKIATKVLHDGDMVEVDAEKGMVRKL